MVVLQALNVRYLISFYEWTSSFCLLSSMVERWLETPDIYVQFMGEAFNTKLGVDKHVIIWYNYIIEILLL